MKGPKVPVAKFEVDIIPTTSYTDSRMCVPVSGNVCGISVHRHLWYLACTGEYLLERVM